MKTSFYKFIVISFIRIYGFSVYSSSNNSFDSIKRDLILDDDQSINIWSSLIVDNETAGSFMVHVKGDYVFFPNYLNRDTMMSVIGRLFREIVKKANLKTDGEKHTLYSLRHSAIMYRLLLSNVNTLKLAKNARTSQAMIEKYYASRLTNQMNIDELHSFDSCKTKDK